MTESVLAPPPGGRRSSAGPAFIVDYSKYEPDQAGGRWHCPARPTPRWTPGIVACVIGICGYLSGLPTGPIMGTAFRRSARHSCGIRFRIAPTAKAAWGGGGGEAVPAGRREPQINTARVGRGWRSCRGVRPVASVWYIPKRWSVLWPSTVANVPVHWGSRRFWKFVLVPAPDCVDR